MAIAFGAMGSGVTGTDSVVATLPTGITVGDMLWAWAGTNPDLTPVTPTDWILACTFSGGLGSGTASGAGQRRSTIYIKPASGSDTNPTISCVGSSIQARTGRISKASNKNWAFFGTGGSDNVADGNWIISASNPLASNGGLRSGDYILAITVSNSTFANTSSWSAEAVTISGCTFNATERDETAGSNGMDRIISDHLCTAGQSSIATISYTATLIFGNATGNASTKATGATAMLVLREVEDGIVSFGGSCFMAVEENSTTAVVSFGGSSNFISVAVEESEEVEDDPPMVIIHSPTPGARISPNDMISFTIVDDTGFGLVLPMIRLPDGRYEVIHDGESFAPDYLGSIRTEVVPGVQYRYDIVRVGGFPLPAAGQTEKEIKLFPFVADMSGQGPA